jgi:uncharacterized phage-associated protein
VLPVIRGVFNSVKTKAQSPIVVRVDYGLKKSMADLAGDPEATAAIAATLANTVVGISTALTDTHQAAENWWYLHRLRMRQNLRLKLSPLNFLM